MTTESEDKILNAILDLSQRIDRLEQDKAKDKQEILAAIEEIRSEMRRNVQQWDERFYQLSRDTLNFVRNVITAGVIVAILVPAVKEAVPLIVSTLRAPQ